jgi:hypothetical protein
MRTIQSPGVEIREFDLTSRLATFAGTDVFVTGFADKGPTDEVIRPSSLREFEAIYGVPKTAAERYLYYSVDPLIRAGANVYVSRMPYGADTGIGFGSYYGALVYPVQTVAGNNTLSGYSLNLNFDNAFTTQALSGAAFQIQGSNGTACTVNFAIGSDAPYRGGVGSVVSNVWTVPIGASSTKAQAINAITTFVAASAAATPSKGITLTSSNNTITIQLSGLVNVTSTGAVSSSIFAGLDDADDVFTISTLPTVTLGSNLNISSGTYVLGKPKQFNLTKSQYLSILDGVSWSATASAVGDIDSVDEFKHAGLVILNKGQTTVNTRFEGYYVGLADNTNFDPATQYDSLIGVNTVTTSAASTGNSTYVSIPSNRINFALSGSNTSRGTVSEVMEGLAGFDVSSDAYDDILNIGVFKLRQSIFTPDALTLDYVLEDGAAASLDYHRQIGDQNGGSALSFFVDSRLNDKSRNVTVLVNDYISNRASSTWVDQTGNPTKKVRVLSRSLANRITAGTTTDSGIPATNIPGLVSSIGYADELFPIGAYSDESFASKELGSIPLKLDRILDLVRNDEIYNIDVSVEAGLGTIYATTQALGTSTFDDTATGTGLTTGLAALQTTGTYTAPPNAAEDLRGNYNTIFSKFQTFAEIERKDHLFIADPLRHILVTGSNNKTLRDASKNWSQHIFSALRHQFSLANTSYATTYANWARVNDKFSGRDIWVPFSGIAASIMTTTDTNNDPWFAPAGFTRGRVFGVNDIAVEPNQKQRDDLYKFSLNPITAFREGITVFGQKTLQKMPGAFDRINVRRLFLYLEKVTKSTSRYYVFEPNSNYTRTRIINDLRPLFERAKNNEGVYDYVIICDNRNNTPDVIDQNELIIDIYIKPVRSAEFILVNFYATRTGSDFSELIG